jgi:hypothetical protein
MITNYQIGTTLSLLDSTDPASDAKAVFYSTTTGLSTGTGQPSAVTTIALCNTAEGDVTLVDETVDQVIVSIYLVKHGKSAVPANRIVSNLIIPAGETVFFNDERLILDGNGSQMDSIWVGASSADKLSVTVSTLPV